MTSRPLRLAATALATVGALVLATASATTPVSATEGSSKTPPVAAIDPPGSLRLAYDVVGSTHLGRSDFDVPLGPSVIRALLLSDASFTAGIPLPPQRVSFTGAGILDVESTVLFTQVGKATGHLNNNPLTVDATARYIVTIRNATIDGKPARVGAGCQTVRPFKVTVATPPGQVFDLDEGGPLIGSYELPRFYNCGKTTDLINILVPGPDNQLTLTLSGGRITPYVAPARAKADTVS